MVVFITTFCLAVAGSLICSSAYFALKHFACLRHSETLAMGRGRAESVVSEPHVDPVLNFGCILTCYGATALTLVSVLPGALALERTILAFAYMCVGGLVGEIASARTSTEPPNVDADETAPESRKGGTLRLSLALTMTLNLTFAVLSSGQGLIEIVPPPEARHSSQESQLDPIIVIGQRRYDPIGENTATD